MKDKIITCGDCSYWGDVDRKTTEDWYYCYCKIHWNTIQSSPRFHRNHRCVYGKAPERSEPKQCNCGGHPYFVYTESSDSQILRCDTCDRKVETSKRGSVIEYWNQITPDYIIPVKEKCSTCKYWRRHDEQGVLPEGNCRNHCIYNKRMEHDWCGDWKPK